jgi:hypothetical protein
MFVIPAKAGIHFMEGIDSRLRGNDRKTGMIEKKGKAGKVE